MPLLDHETAIKQYWEEVKNKYPQISFNSFMKICKSPFHYFKKKMASATMPFILIKYFGRIRPYKKGVQEAISAWNYLYRTNQVNEFKYLEEHTRLTQYLEQLKKLDHDAPEAVINRPEIVD